MWPTWGRRKPANSSPHEHERLSDEQRAILAALLQGCHLKVHRTLDGEKTYRLHCPAQGGAVTELPSVPVTVLEREGYLQSNMKFPAASLLLTERGVQVAAHVAGPLLNPVGPRRYTPQ